MRPFPILNGAHAEGGWRVGVGYVRRTGQIPMLINQWVLFVDGQACFNTHACKCGPHAQLINGIFEAIKVSCKHMKANQLVSGVHYRGFNTDLEVKRGSGWRALSSLADLGPEQSLMQINQRGSGGSDDLRTACMAIVYKDGQAARHFASLTLMQGQFKLDLFLVYQRGRERDMERGAREKERVAKSRYFALHLSK